MREQELINIEQVTDTLEISKHLRRLAFVFALVEGLVDEGLLTEQELAELRRRVVRRLAQKYKRKGTGSEPSQPRVDKYTFEHNSYVDCQSRIQVCKAACCRLGFTLSLQDLQEGTICWDATQPFCIAQGPDGFCVHLDRESCDCTIYDQRPVPCRAYDCSKDKRIWADFESRILNPEVERRFR